MISKMETKRQWPPAGYESAADYILDMTVTGAWGSDNYFAWKQLRIQQENLISEMLVAPDFKIVTDVYDVNADYTIQHARSRMVIGQ